MTNIIALPRAERHVFWAEVSPCEHVVQIYGDDRVFLDGLEGFVGNGLRAGEAAVVMATAMHLHGLEKRLRDNGVDVEGLRLQKRYVPLLAEDVLARSLANITFTLDPLAGSYPRLLADGVEAGTTKQADITGLFDLRPLNGVSATKISAAGLGQD